MNPNPLINCPPSTRAAISVIRELILFQKTLDESQEIVLKFPYDSGTISMLPDKILDEKPDVLIFYGVEEGNPIRVIQHVSHLNLVVSSRNKEEKSKPARRVGFYYTAAPELEIPTE